MELQVQGGFKDMTEADATAIADYLKTVPAVANTPQAPPQMPTTGGVLVHGWMWTTLAGLIAMLGVLLALTGVIWRLSERSVRR